VLFSLKIVKIANRWGLCPKTPTSIILHCGFFSLHLPTKHGLFQNRPKVLFSCNYGGRHQAFGVEKIMLYFVCRRLRKL